MDEQKIIDMSHDIADKLQNEASAKLSEAQTYYKGYVQACEDFGRRLRQEIYSQRN